MFSFAWNIDSPIRIDLANWIEKDKSFKFPARVKEIWTQNKRTPMNRHRWNELKIESMNVPFVWL